MSKHRLGKYALTLQADFYLGFEFLPFAGPAGLACYYGARFGGAAIVRTSSLRASKREPSTTLAAHSTVQ